METLKAEELMMLIDRVFKPTPEDRAVAVLVDLPDEQVKDHEEWKNRREMAASWVLRLRSIRDRLSYEVGLFLYGNVHSNNADLPDRAWAYEEGPLPNRAEDLDSVPGRSFREVLGTHRIVIAPTEFSTTAPMKLLAPRLGFRAATMPGLGESMIPALRLDYVEINRRVQRLKEVLDRSERAEIRFSVPASGEHYDLTLDLRHRTSHASGGLLPEIGFAGNLPSGETYIVPYEGEIEGDPSSSQGVLPVQLGEEIVLYRIEENQAVEVISEGEISRKEAESLRTEPAYGNLAELGFGVLGDFGLKPIGEILLDEKLGLHIAFGRSDHFGGQVGASRFTSPEAVVHIDRVYLPETQPKIMALGLDVVLEGGDRVEMVRDGRLVFSF